MREYLEIEGKQYRYISDYKNNQILRTSFNNLARKTFGIDFEQWYNGGYWGDGYITYSLLEDEIVVANVSVSIMEFLILDEQKRYIQIGTVMTADEYRGRGLCKALMERVLKEWEDKCELIYLFANDSVLEFYPKFGFVPMNEYQCSINVNKKCKSRNMTKMDMANKNHRELLYNIVNNRISFSKVTMLNCISLVMFYCTSFMKDSIYYLEDYNTVVIAEFDGNKLYVQDIFSTKDIKLDIIIDEIISDEIKEVILGFTPNENLFYEEILFKDEDTTLFVKGRERNIFGVNKLMFPILSHA
ncbi:GNAT family N-acetyltransferase [Clostridium gasigenes]|uniref:GNAT family N-acetyltransferase n=1 Tax=Clostridium gasigenes TaxID=94869 RepID=UPI001628A58D|nr:GNAT family N-acetyltransferase [Clostridium gasigenes]MBB6625588.1 GNAT family N-acetyltransferase [Clostridium gasigenes]MBU3090310.1 GNAT family N-acetyltransferase [Clostridium gasigenes]